MRTSYQLQSQQSNTKHLQRRVGGKRFAFTNSSKVLPKQHSPEEFGDIIDNKKIYQSMIKDELRKLQAMQACIADPQIEPFIVPTDIVKVPSSFNKNQKIIIKKPVINKKIVANEIDEYLDQQIDKNKYNTVSKVINKVNCTNFYNLLLIHHKNRRKQKAAAYFNYELTCRKIFSKLKSLANLDEITDNTFLLKQQQIKKIKLTININIFKYSTQKLRLQERIKVYRKTKQFRNKKTAIIHLVKKISLQSNLRKSYVQLRKIVLKNKLTNMFEMHRKIKQIQYSAQILTKVRIHRQLIAFTDNQKSKILKNSKIFKIIKEKIVNVKSSQIKVKQIQIQKYCKDKNLSEAHKKQIIRNMKYQVIARQFKQNRLLKQQKAFIDLLKLHNKFCQMNKIRDQSKIKIKNSKYLLKNMKQKLFLERKFIRIRTMRLKKYFNQCKANFEKDRKLSNSLNNCLTGCKQWLINNKHIFKMQTKINTSSQMYIQYGQNQSSISLSHPLKNKSKTQLLSSQSKFKKTSQMYFKRTLLKILKQNLRKKKQQQIVTYAAKMLYKSRLINKIWRIMKDKQLLIQIKKQISEQIQIQADQQAIRKVQKVQFAIFNIKIKSFFTKLANQTNFKDKIQQLLMINKQNYGKKIINKFKNVHILHRNNVQLSQKTGIQKDKLKTQLFSKLKLQLLKNKSIKQKQKAILKCYQKYKPTNTQIISNSSRDAQQNSMNSLKIDMIIKQYVQTLQKRSFLNLIRNNWNISVGSVQVTSLYLKNKLKKIKQFYQMRNRIQINQNKKGQLVNKILLNSFNRFICHSKKNIQINQKYYNLNKFLDLKRIQVFYKKLKNSSKLQINEKQRKLNFKKLKRRLLKTTFKKLTQNCKTVKQQRISLQNNKKNEQIIVKTQKLIENQPRNVTPNELNFNILKFQQNSMKGLQSDKLDQGISDSNYNQQEGKQVKSELSSPSKFIQYQQFSHASNKEELNKYLQERIQNNEQESQISMHSQQNGKRPMQYVEKSESNSEQQQLSYQQYRKSLIQIKSKKLNQISNNQTPEVSKKEEEKPSKMHKKQQFYINYPYQRNDQLQNLSQYKNQLSQSKNDRQSPGNKQRDSYSDNLWQQYLNYEETPQKQLTQSSISLDTEYFQNRYNQKLCRKFFINWKNVIENNADKSQIKQDKSITQDQVNSADLLHKAWSGLKMYAKQKILTRKYLKQYQQQLHYYPHNREEYLEFKKITQI